MFAAQSPPKPRSHRLYCSIYLTPSFGVETRKPRHRRIPPVALNFSFHSQFLNPPTFTILHHHQHNRIGVQLIAYPIVKVHAHALPPQRHRSHRLRVKIFSFNYLHRQSCLEGAPTCASRITNKQISEPSKNTRNMDTMILPYMAILPDHCPRPGQTFPRPPLTSLLTIPIRAAAPHPPQAARMDTLFLICLHTCANLAPSSLLQQLKRVTFEHISMA